MLGVLLAKETRLRHKVLLHRAVVVEMVVTQVGERGHTEAKPLDAPLIDRMARDLEGDDRVTTLGVEAGNQLSECAVKLGTGGCRSLVRQRSDARCVPTHD